MLNSNIVKPIRPLLMQLKYIYQKTAFLMINFPTGFFQALVLILQLVKIKKGNKKVIFTGRLLGGACTLYSIGESVQCIHSLCVCVCVFFPFILDIKFVGRTSRGHTGGRSHRIFNPPSFCGACLDFCREKDSAIPFPRRP